MADKTVLAAIQAEPVLFDRAASTEKAIGLIREAGRQGAHIAAFGETWLPGYPYFAYAGANPDRWQAAQEYLGAAVEIPGPEINALCAAAKQAKLDVVIGVAELDSRTKGTVYCTAVTIGREGVVLGRHRKLKPTMDERMVWAEGRGDDLNVYERPYGRLSALNCWEHQMVLPGYAMMAQGTQFHVSTWPGGDHPAPPDLPVTLWPRQELLSRAFAAQAASYVIAVGGVLKPENVPEHFRFIFGDGPGNPGNSLIIDPRGEVVARAEPGQETILTWEADHDVIRAAKVANDVAGHYSRPDVFELLIHGKPVAELEPLKGPNADHD